MDEVDGTDIIHYSHNLNKLLCKSILYIIDILHINKCMFWYRSRHDDVGTRDLVGSQITRYKDV